MLKVFQLDTLKEFHFVFNLKKKFNILFIFKNAFIFRILFFFLIDIFILKVTFVHFEEVGLGDLEFQHKDFSILLPQFFFEMKHCWN